MTRVTRIESCGRMKGNCVVKRLKDNLETKGIAFPQIYERVQKKKLSTCKFTTWRKKFVRYILLLSKRTISFSSYLDFLLPAALFQDVVLLRRHEIILVKGKRRIKLYVKMQAVACTPRLGIRLDDYAFPESNSVGRYKMLWNDTRGLYIENLSGRNMGTSWVGLKERSEKKSFPIAKGEKFWGRDIRSTTKGQQLLYFEFAAGFSPSLKRSALLCPSWLLCSVSGVKRLIKRSVPRCSQFLSILLENRNRLTQF